MVFSSKTTAVWVLRLKAPLRLSLSLPELVLTILSFSFPLRIHPEEGSVLCCGWVGGWNPGSKSDQSFQDWILFPHISEEIAPVSFCQLFQEQFLASYMRIPVYEAAWLCQ